MALEKHLYGIYSSADNLLKPIGVYGIIFQIQELLMHSLKSQNHRQKALKWSSFLMVTIFIYAMNLHLLYTPNLSVDVVAMSLLIDLVIWVPLIYHWVIVRKDVGPKFITKLLLSIGLVMSYHLIPAEAFIRPLADFYPAMLAILVSTIIVLAITRLVPAITNSRDMPPEERIHYLASKVCRGSGFENVLKTEWMAMYYGVFGWRLQKSPDQKKTFSYHQKSGNVGLIIGLSIFQIPGLIFTHIIFHNISPIIALVLTVAHIYTLYFGLSQAMAMRNRFIHIGTDHVALKCGLMFDADIAISNIKQVKKVSALETEEDVDGQLKATFFGFSNIRIELYSAQKIPIFAGMTTSCDQIVIGVDEANAFVRQLNLRLDQNTNL